MPDPSIKNLLAALQKIFGPRFRLYVIRDVEEEHHLSFTLEGIDATFSAITFDGSLPLNRFDVQVDSFPDNGEYIYIYNTEISLDEFLKLLDRFAGPIDEWPVCGDEGRGIAET